MIKLDPDKMYPGLNKAVEEGTITQEEANLLMETTQILEGGRDEDYWPDPKNA